jgi:hypothetical protein
VWGAIFLRKRGGGIGGARGGRGEGGFGGSFHCSGEGGGTSGDSQNASGLDNNGSYAYMFLLLPLMLSIVPGYQPASNFRVTMQ